MTRFVFKKTAPPVRPAPLRKGELEHLSLRQKAGVAEAVSGGQRRPKEWLVAPGEKPPVIRWGTLQERYTQRCMQLLVQRFKYYVLGHPGMEDQQYDTFEGELSKMEREHPELIHPNSPTQVPGSDRAEDYPAGVRWYCLSFLGLKSVKTEPAKKFTFKRRST